MEIYLFTGTEEDKVVFIQDHGKFVFRSTCDMDKNVIRNKLLEVIDNYLDE